MSAPNTDDVEPAVSDTRQATMLDEEALDHDRGIALAEMADREIQNLDRDRRRAGHIDHDD